MSAAELLRAQSLTQRLAEAEAIIEALVSGQIDAVVDPKSHTPVLLSKAQTALRESEGRYRQIVETANEGISIVDTESNFTFVNRRFCEMTGFSAAELIGKSLFALVPESARAAAEWRVERSREGISDENEVEYCRKDRSTLWALIKTSPIHGPDGEWAGTLGMTTDRTKQRQAAEALRKSEEQYRQIVEATTDGIVKVDVDTRIVFVNGRFAEMLGYEPREMIGASVKDFMSDAARAILQQMSEQPLAPARGTVDTTFRHKGGNDIAVNATRKRLFDGDGKDVGALGVIRDITEERKLQSQLMVSDRMASVGTLAAGVAHEINNPLAVVIANLDYVVENVGRIGNAEPSPADARTRDVWLQEEIRAPLDDAREAAERVRFIVRDLKMFSRAPADEARGSVDVKAIMESALRMGWNEIRHRARLVKNYGVVPGVEVNEARLGQVFLNLVINAAQALPDGCAEQNEIRVATRIEGERAIIEVADTGSGIPPEIIGRIFDAFFTTKAVGVGTGLGLAICQRIVTDMGGDLGVESEVGKGTTFRVSLPLTRATESTPPPPIVVTPVAGRRGRILVVDDETMVANSVRRILSKDHDVVALVAAKEALALCAGGERFDLILCDLMMPDMTGMDFHDELARVAPEQADKMIFMTGGAFTTKAQQFLSQTPREHLEKPFHPGNLRAIVQRYLR